MRMRPSAALEERIVELIHERGLAPGAAMPSEPRLMESLGASRNSVREAIHRRIVTALRDRDADAARDAMRLHFRDVRPASVADPAGEEARCDPVSG